MQNQDCNKSIYHIWYKTVSLKFFCFQKEMYKFLFFKKKNTLNAKAHLQGVSGTQKILSTIIKKKLKVNSISNVKIIVTKQNRHLVGRFSIQRRLITKMSFYIC